MHACIYLYVSEEKEKNTTYIIAALDNLLSILDFSLYCGFFLKESERSRELSPTCGN